MKVSGNSKKWLKLCLAVSLVLNILFVAGVSVIEATKIQEFQYSDNYLYGKYLHYRDSDPVYSVMYLWAYVWRETDAYVYNIDGYRDEVDKEIKDLRSEILHPKNEIENVNSEIRSCGCFPCGECKDSIASSKYQGITIPQGTSMLNPPPNSVVVCTSFEYTGDCRVLSPGVYNSYPDFDLPNDSITSVMVGTSAQVTFYAHGSLTGSSITFDSSEPDLSSYTFDGQYPWHNNVTSLEVIAGP